MNFLSGLALIVVFVAGYLLITSTERKYSILDGAQGCGSQLRVLLSAKFGRLLGMKSYYSFHRQYTRAIKQNEKTNRS